jgi:AAA family ATP:ADP antiporter
MSLIHQFFKFASDIRENELRATLISFCLVFTLMAAYYILRPLRDSLASDWSDAEVSWLWTFTFFFSAFTVWLYAVAIRYIRFRHLVAFVYAFFAISFLLFYLGTVFIQDRVLIDKSFYVWVSVFSLFHISVFWSLMAEVFSTPQSHRLFGFIGAGASVGAMAGPTVALLLVTIIGTDSLLMLSSLILLLTLPLSYWIQSLQKTVRQGEASPGITDRTAVIGGNPISGYSAFLKSPYLLMIGVFILLYTTISSFVYFELKNLLVDYDREARSQIWAAMDLSVNVLTVSLAMFATGRIASRFGLSVTLASIPLIVAAGLLLLSLAPIIGVVIGVQIIRRAGNYAVSRPAREMLFTVVSRDIRFKAKPVIDIVLYRGGDMLNAWAFTALTQGFGLSLAAIAGIGSVVALIWAGTGIYLGREAAKRTQNEDVVKAHC